MTSAPGRILNGLLRLAGFVVFAMLAGAMLTRLNTAQERSSQPAGFLRGVVQGALMPMAMPNLLVGRDVPIYAESNTGRTYKLGYTVGVNACGAVFFGFLFWRLNRLHKLAREHLARSRDPSRKDRP